MRYGIIVLDINTAIKPLNTGVKQGKAVDNEEKQAKGIMGSVRTSA